MRERVVGFIFLIISSSFLTQIMKNDTIVSNVIKFKLRHQM